MRKLGVIGGLGSIASAHFYELIIRMTDAELDQDHLEMLIYNKPSIPDRTEYILGRSTDNPVIPMIDAGKVLAQWGAAYIAIPCITSHYFYEELLKGIEKPIIHTIKETAQYLNAYDVCRVGVMATEGTICSGLFQKEFQRFGIKTILPSKQKQDFISEVIYQDIKANKPPDMHKFYAASEELRGLGAQVIVLGCSELSLIKRDWQMGSGYIDAMEVLAMRSILLCGARLRKEYQRLIT
jgi:aspartate racemase